MKEFIVQNGGLIATIVLVVIALNAILMGFQSILEVVMKFTPKWETDNKIHAFIGKILIWTHKLVDWLGGNRKHAKEKPDEEDEEKA